MLDALDRLPGAFWYLLAFVLAAGGILLNSGPLFYFDTAGYLAQGVSILRTLGLEVPLPASAAPGLADAAADSTVTGSRAAVYSTLIAAAHVLTGLTLLAVAQALALLLALWLLLRPALRGTEEALAPRLALLTVAGSLGTLPFITIYLMPDIFAPILLLVIATLAIYRAEMTLLEILLALGLGALAVVTHPSHLAIAVLMIPVAGLILLLMRPKGWGWSLLLLALLPLAGIAERAAFTTAAKAVKEAEVVYQPFLTVRAIADGPGYAYLEDHCPEEGLATCALWDALQVSDDPYRLTASHIMFERDPRLGSFQLLSPEEQGAIAAEQMRFFLRVALARPVGMGMAFLRNTLDQAAKNNLSLAIPTRTVLREMQEMTAHVPDYLGEIAALGGRGWMIPVDWLHRGVYALSMLGVLTLMVLARERPPLPVRGAVLLILAGVFVNAFVCGGVSQPSDRYGARVIFLLPVAAAFLWAMRRRSGEVAG